MEFNFLGGMGRGDGMECCWLLGPSGCCCEICEFTVFFDDDDDDDDDDDEESWINPPDSSFLKSYQLPLHPHR